MKKDLVKAVDVLARTRNTLELDIAYGDGDKTKAELSEAIDVALNFIVDILKSIQNDKRKGSENNG